MRESQTSFEFQWVKNQNYFLYESRRISFKLKLEPIAKTNGEKQPGIEVYISDDPRQKNWRPLRFFPELDFSKCQRWVELFAQRILKNY